MSKNKNIRETDFKEVKKYAIDVEVNGQQSEVSGKLDFNDEKGTFKATVSVTTKQVDILNEGPTMNSLKAAADVLEMAVRKGIELRLHHLDAISEGPDAAQTSFLDDSDFVNEDNPPRKKKKDTEPKEKETFGSLSGGKAPIGKK